MAIPKRMKNLYELIMDFMKKCNDDHVAAFGSMSAFFILLSLFPFLIFFLTLTKYAPFSKDDIIHILSQMISFERRSLITSIVNEIYRKTETSVFTVSIIGALWSSSRGVYSIVIGLNSVYDIEETRNYIVLRIFSIFYTVMFAAVIVVMLLLWVFGNLLYDYISGKFPALASLAAVFIHKRMLFTIIILTIIFMLMYRFVPSRKASSLWRQWPGALVAAVGWIVVSSGCSFYMTNFNFSYIYGSLSGIMILLLWLHFCMSMVFYGAEINYFLENKNNYHELVRIFRPNFRAIRRQREKELKEKRNRRTKEK
ncbi:MAG: YihY/virulence factor BrkB family protein [Eubacteriales bacterium]|nr:YihY/virulence factor BrkB family protein [Eubacteriales bacterium]